MKINGMSTYHWILGSLHVLGVDVLNLDVLSCDRVPHGPAVLAGLLGRDVILRLAIGTTKLLGVVVYVGISLLLVPVQTVHELFDVWYFVTSRVVLPRGVHLLVFIHVHWLTTFPPVFRRRYQDLLGVIGGSRWVNSR